MAASRRHRRGNDRLVRDDQLYPLIDSLPPLSDEAAALIFEWVSEFAFQFEAAYYSQILRHHQQHRAEQRDSALLQPDLFTRPDDPPF